MNSASSPLVALVQAGGIDAQTALVVAATAAVLGQLLGALLTFVGSLINDHFTRRREQRQQEREERLREEQRAREEKLREAQERARVYKSFVRATTFATSTTSQEIEKKLDALNESYTEIQTLASEEVRDAARELYSKANDEMNATESDPSFLDSNREDFWDSVRNERTKLDR